MKLPESWTTVTPLSKSITMILFIFLPFIGFFAGMRYQQKIQDTEQLRFIQTKPANTPSPSPISTITPSEKSNLPSTSAKACSLDAMQCPSGVWVGRTGPNCQFVCPKQ